MPEFASRDPLAPAFWDERFERGFTPWERAGVPEAVRAFVASSPRPLSTLIPGCGSAIELGYLCEAGWDATAIDFSPVAVETGRALAGQWAQRLELADFFSYQPPRPLDCIYERAFLCAMPRKMWPAVAARWAALLPPGGLLAGYFFFDAVAKGPPFGADRDELAGLLAPYFDCIVDDPVADSIPIFAGKERWMVWRRR